MPPHTSAHLPPSLSLLAVSRRTRQSSPSITHSSFACPLLTTTSSPSCTCCDFGTLPNEGSQCGAFAGWGGRAGVVWVGGVLSVGWGGLVLVGLLRVVRVCVLRVVRVVVVVCVCVWSDWGLLFPRYMSEAQGH